MAGSPYRVYMVITDRAETGHDVAVNGTAVPLPRRVNSFFRWWTDVDRYLLDNPQDDHLVFVTNTRWEKVAVESTGSAAAFGASE